MLFAMTDATVMWIVTAIIGFGNVALASWLMYLREKLAVERERRLAWKAVAKEQAESTQGMANAALEKAGLPPVAQVANVVADSNSPATEKQIDDAELATAKAQIVAIRLAVGQPPRPEPDRAGEKPVVTVSDVRTAVKDALTEKVDAVKKDVKVIRSDVAEVKEEILGDKP